jgi:hypothetical protein
MNEKDLLKLWNEKRSQVISAQMGSTYALIALLIAATFGKLDSASDAIKYLALGVVAATGFFGIVSQYAAIREGEALIEDLSKLKERSAVANKVAESRGLLSLTAIAVVGVGLAIFALSAWAVLG